MALPGVDLGNREFRAAPWARRSFGAHGAHFCLGAHLARREIAPVYRELFAGMPDLRLTGGPDRLRSIVVHGLKHLPVVLEGTDTARCGARSPSVERTSR